MHSSHATHVSGIAAGNAGTLAGNVRISGVAPRAYLGNYKVLTVPTEGFGLNGNAPEIAAGIDEVPDAYEKFQKKEDGAIKFVIQP